MKPCCLDECEANSTTKGFCEAHYSRWRNMMRRCNDASHKKYKNYGGRGISVCQGWSKSPSNFYDDIGYTPFPEASLDRPDNEGGYWCGHCDECLENGWPKNWRWATKAEQVLNRRPIKNNSTGHVGIHRRGKRFEAYLWREKVSRYLGSFDTVQEAVEVREKAVLLHNTKGQKCC